MGDRLGFELEENYGRASSVPLARHRKVNYTRSAITTNRTLPSLTICATVSFTDSVNSTMVIPHERASAERPAPANTGVGWRERDSKVVLRLLLSFWRFARPPGSPPCTVATVCRMSCRQRPQGGVPILCHKLGFELETDMADNNIPKHGRDSDDAASGSESRSSESHGLDALTPHQRLGQQLLDSLRRLHEHDLPETP